MLDTAYTLLHTRKYTFTKLCTRLVYICLMSYDNKIYIYKCMYINDTKI